ncbi:MAG TPA: BamA/TamA family outer membrane protein, partial [Bryobacteraceae bacterium]|nr:BamA/TamA family outer membrane protein [Bryobacteraceae bacterium]
LQTRLPFRTGSPFHERELRDAIQNLFATGRFADLAVDAERTAGGVALRFITQNAYFVGHVEIPGVPQPPNSGQLTSATKLRLGMPFVEADKNQAIESLKNLLRQNGFYHADVSAKVEYRPSTEQANLTFDIRSGDRARFDQPVIGGDPQRPEAALVRATRWKRLYGLLGWQQVTDARVRQGLENLRRFYEKRNLLESKVTLTRLDYQPRTNRVKPSIDIEAGPKVVVRVDGARISRGKLTQLLPVYQERSVDPDLLTEGDRELAQYFQGEGYFEATVAHSMSEAAHAGERTITYTVDRGHRHKFVHLDISGNRYFSGQTIRERLFIEPARLPRFPYGRFNDAYLQQDVQAIRNLYSSNGFRDVKVSSRIEDDYARAEGHLAVFIHIDEGPQWFVSDLSLAGMAASDRPNLESMLASSENQPFSEASVADDRDNFLNYYYSRGYLNATFDYDTTPAAQPNRVNVHYVLRPGERKYVREVLVSGLETTRSRLVYDRLELRSGEPLSLSKETDSQRRLYDLGIFARVNTAIQNPAGDEDQKNVLYDMDEARHYSLNVGIGAQIARIGGGVTTRDNPAGTAGFAPRLAVGVTRINLFGLGQTLGLQTAASTIDQRAALTYFIPQFVSNEKLSLTTTTLIENSNDIRTYTAHRREASIQLAQRLSRAYTLEYRLVFRNVSLSNVKIQQLLVPLLSQPETVGLGSFSFIQDKRDDPADAHHGIFTSLDLSYAPGFLGSQTHFARGLFRNSTYHLFRRDLVFARSSQFGLISRTGGRPGIPLAERIYSGGSTSLRAFADFQAGPRDFTTGFPLGGNALFTNTFELRFPLYGDNVGGVLFHDAGNVYSSLNQFSLRFRQRDLRDFNYMVQSVGFGIRYRTPIGPVRLDFSFSPNAPRFFGLKGTVQDLVNGTAISTVQKISSFQFHFSLGQAF